MVLIPLDESEIVGTRAEGMGKHDIMHDWCNKMVKSCCQVCKD